MAEKKVIELEVKENLGNLKQQLKQAQVEVQVLADKFGVTSDQAREAAKKAAELKDRIGDAKALTDAFNPDAKFKGLAQALTGVTGGFAAVQGAMALVGSQSEDVEKTLLKVQSAMALAAGIDQLTEAKEAFVNLGKTAVKAFSAIKGAIGATGIGLIVVSLGVIYTYWEDISKAIGLSTKESEKYAKQQKLIGEQAKKQSEEIAKESGAFATLISRLKATNQNSKEREELIKKINTQYGTTLKNIKDERNFQEQLNTELASYLEYQKAKYSLQKNEDLIVKNLEKQDEINRKLKESQKNLNKAIEEGAGLKRKGKVDIEDKFVQDILVNEQATKIAETERENIKKLIKEQEKAEQRFESYGEAAQKASVKVGILTNAGTKYVEQIVKDAPKITETLNQFKQDVDNLNEEIRVSKLNDEEKEIDALNKKYDKVIEEGKKHGINVKALEEEKRLALAAITKKYDDADASTRLTNSQSVISDIVSEGTKRLQAEKAISDKSTEQLKKELQDQTNLRERNLKFIIESMLQVLSITQDLASMSENKYKEINDKVLANENLTTAQKEKAIIKNNANAKKAFELNKKFQIASTLISTFAAARDAYKSQFLPPDISSPVRGGIAAGIATAGGLVAVKKIMSTQFQGTAVPSGGDGGGGGATVPTMSAPQFNVVGQSGVNQLASLNQQPIQAYVVSGQVTSQQALDRNRLANATLGG